LRVQRKEFFMALSEEMGLINNNIPDKIMMKVSSFPSMPRAGIKLRRALLKVLMTALMEPPMSGVMEPL
jgi:hypothetical protein